ncbi:MAG TPA: hypothetical protein VE954_02120 [Oligoflexus sp.]|nr:hypothetical protein [Oligoflexus sp.]
MLHIRQTLVLDAIDGVFLISLAAFVIFLGRRWIPVPKGGLNILKKDIDQACRETMCSLCFGILNACVQSGKG